MIKLGNRSIGFLTRTIFDVTFYSGLCTSVFCPVLCPYVNVMQLVTAWRVV